VSPLLHHAGRRLGFNLAPHDANTLTLEPTVGYPEFAALRGKKPAWRVICRKSRFADWGTKPADQALNQFIFQYDVGVSSAPSALARAVLFF
jgi:hypothetical protein